MPTLVVNAPNLRIAYEGPLLVAVWTGAPQTGQISEINRVASRASAAHGRPVALFDVIAEGRPEFTEALRKEGAKVVQTSSDIVLAVAHVVVPKGLAGSAMWAFLSTMTLLGRASAPTKVFGNLQDGAHWLASQIADRVAGWSPERVLETYEEVRAAT
ncbi:MAG: hypothetical protein K8H88_27320 [Sandaracinaceae bacterium]|nr:hypothetical protein [Sandaracinaceae bacterium]